MERLSFEKAAEVADGDRLGFVMLGKDGADLMLRTWASADKDVFASAPREVARGTPIALRGW
jgi:hypothetical protein